MTVQVFKNGKVWTPSTAAMDNYYATYMNSSSNKYQIPTGSSDSIYQEAQKEMAKTAKRQRTLQTVMTLGTLAATTAAIAVPLVKSKNAGKSGKTSSFSTEQLEQIVNNAQAGSEKDVKKAIAQLESAKASKSAEQAALEKTQGELAEAAKTAAENATNKENEAATLTKTAGEKQADYEIAKTKTSEAKSAWQNYTIPAEVKDENGNVTNQAEIDAAKTEKSRLEKLYKDAVGAEAEAKLIAEQAQTDAKEATVEAKKLRKLATTAQLDADKAAQDVEIAKKEVTAIQAQIKLLGTKQTALQARDQADGNFVTRIFNKKQRTAHDKKIEYNKETMKYTFNVES